MANALDAVIAQNKKRLAESRQKQKETPLSLRMLLGQVKPDSSIKPPTGDRPTLNAVYSSTPQDPTPWAPVQQAQKEWDAQMSRYKSAQSAASDPKKAGYQFWEEQRVGWEEANEDTRVNFGAMLDELAEFRINTVLSPTKMDSMVAEEEEKLRVNTEEIMRNFYQDNAQTGRSASAYAGAELRKRLMLANRDKLSTTKINLQKERASLHAMYVDRLYNVLGNTQSQVMDPSTAMAFMQQIGSSAAGQYVTMGGGGNFHIGGRKSGSSNSVLGDGGSLRRGATQPTTDSWISQQHARNERGWDQHWSRSGTTNPLPSRALSGTPSLDTSGYA